jgi:hypothetical protein
MELLSLRIQMTDTKPTATTAATEIEIAMVAEIGTEIGSEEIEVVTSHTERLTGTKS